MLLSSSGKSCTIRMALIRHCLATAAVCQRPPEQNAAGFCDTRPFQKHSHISQQTLTPLKFPHPVPTETNPCGNMDLGRSGTGKEAQAIYPSWKPGVVGETPSHCMPAGYTQPSRYVVYTHSAFPISNLNAHCSVLWHDKCHILCSISGFNRSQYSSICQCLARAHYSWPFTIRPDQFNSCKKREPGRSVQVSSLLILTGSERALEEEEKGGHGFSARCQH